jgi:hypothetical protein
MRILITPRPKTSVLDWVTTDIARTYRYRTSVYRIIGYDNEGPILEPIAWRDVITITVNPKEYFFLDKTIRSTPDFFGLAKERTLWIQGTAFVGSLMGVVCLGAAPLLYFAHKKTLDSQKRQQEDLQKIN